MGAHVFLLSVLYLCSRRKALDDSLGMGAYPQVSFVQPNIQNAPVGAGFKDDLVTVLNSIGEADNFFLVLLLFDVSDTTVGSRPELRFCIDV